MSLFNRSTGLPNSLNKVKILSLLDVGSNKIACMIVKLTPQANLRSLYQRTHKIEVLGFCCQKAHGISCGVIVDMAAAARSISMAITAAENQAGLVIDSVIVSFSANHVSNKKCEGSLKFLEQTIAKNNVASVMKNALEKIDQSSQRLLHAVPLEYYIGYLGKKTLVVDPIDMQAEQLDITMHTLVADKQPLINLELCINRAHMSVEAFVVSPLASCLSSVMEEEANKGVVCLDLGAGSTSACVVKAGKMIYVDSVPIGGERVTKDIAEIFNISMAEAEKLKLEHGSCSYDEKDELKTFFLNSYIAGEGNYQEEYPKAYLASVISARVKETIEIMRNRLYNAGVEKIVNRQIVLTGGGSQLPGIKQVVADIMGAQVRIGRPYGVSSAISQVRSSCFSTILGLAVYPQMLQLQTPALQEVLLNGDKAMMEQNNKPWALITKWFKGTSA